jgi:outer membrane protein assembly factor BamD
MYRRLLVITVTAVLAFSLVGCTNKKVQNPIANVGSKQPDKVLFDRAMDAMKHNKFDVARMTLQTLINTYPDSEFIARAKLSIGDSWYAEGGTAALQQAEAEYKDFQTFFPQMANEASEAQMKVAKIHYDQMEKPDRDFTHAKRAEEEYRNMIMQYPDSPLVPQAKERLREVQEVLAEREYRIGRFYYLRESWAAAIARLKSLTDTYPLYSGADDALFILGDAYERQVAAVRAVPSGRMSEQLKGKLIKEFEDKAAEAYSRIVARYPVGDRDGDAKGRLKALSRPVPTPTPEAIALNKQEIASRGRLGMWSRAMLTMHKRPDTATTAKVGEPTLVDPRQTSAPEVAKHTVDVLTGKTEEKHEVSIEQVGTGQPAPNQPVPRSENQVDPNAPQQQNAPQQDDGIQSLAPTTGDQGQAAAATAGSPATQPSAPAGQSPAQSASPSPMTPTAQPPAAPSQPASTMQEATPAQAAPAPSSAPAQSATTQTTATQDNGSNSTNGGGSDAPPVPPAQVNDAKSGGDSASAANQTDDKDFSSSKKKKKKGLSKLNPF